MAINDQSRRRDVESVSWAITLEIANFFADKTHSAAGQYHIRSGSQIDFFLLVSSIKKNEIKVSKIKLILNKLSEKYELKITDFTGLNY